jgi:amino acid transporter
VTELVTAQAVGAGTAEERLVRAIGVRGLTLSAVNLIIGAAVFVLPALATQDLGRAAILGYFVCAAGMMLVALCFSDLGSQTVLTGGVYVYVEAGFGPFGHAPWLERSLPVRLLGPLHFRTCRPLPPTIREVQCARSGGYCSR